MTFSIRDKCVYLEILSLTLIKLSPSISQTPNIFWMYFIILKLKLMVAQTVKNLPAMWENWVWSLGWEDPLEKGMVTHSSILAWKIHMDRGVWQTTVHGVAKSQPWLSGFTFTFHFYALEKEMATHSSVLAWRIPGMRSHWVRRDWSDLAAASSSGKEPICQCRRHKRHRFDPWVRKICWRRVWQPTPVFLPKESHGQRSLVGYSP